mgnify:CR=1 FL=1
MADGGELTADDLADDLAPGDTIARRGPMADDRVKVRLQGS